MELVEDETIDEDIVVMIELRLVLDWAVELLEETIKDVGFVVVEFKKRAVVVVEVLPNELQSAQAGGVELVKGPTILVVVVAALLLRLLDRQSGPDISTEAVEEAKGSMTLVVVVGCQSDHANAEVVEEDVGSTSRGLLLVCRLGLPTDSVDLEGKDGTERGSGRVEVVVCRFGLTPAGDVNRGTHPALGIVSDSDEGKLVYVRVIEPGLTLRGTVKATVLVMVVVRSTISPG